jgi:UDP-N-acetylglucosamine 2-epimerase (non-hydrolysing)
MDPHGGAVEAANHGAQPMTAKRKILAIFGTRPEVIKMGPVLTALRADGAFDVVTLATAQHREMLDDMLRVFGIVPDHDLDVMTADQRVVDVTAKCLLGIDAVLRHESPDLALVQGDTTTVLAASLACHYNRILVGHVEAGLRTADKYAPFPEEMNRRVAGVLADLHFAPTAKARENLRREGVPESAIHVTGNTVVDAVLRIAATPVDPADAQLAHILQFTDTIGRLLLVTAHRRESFGAPLRGVCEALAAIVEAHPDTGIVFPVHPNPNVREAVHEILGDRPRVLLVQPLDYVQFVHVMQRATLILTDSGGVQEEAPSLGKPVLVLRDKTERPEGVEAGVAEIVGTDPVRIRAAADRLLAAPRSHEVEVRRHNPYGDGRAAERIVNAIRAALKVM